MQEKNAEEPPGADAGNAPLEDFCALEQRYRSMVYATALRCAGCPETAGEVTQDVFLLLSRSGGRVPPGHVCGWLHRTAVLKCRERLRGERRYRRRLQEYARRAEMQTATAAAGRVLDRLDAALDSLSDADRRVLFLRYFEGLNAAEIAVCMDISAEAAQKKCERARSRLAARLAAGGLLTYAAAHAQTSGLLQRAAGPLPPLRLPAVRTAGFSPWLLWSGAAVAVLLAVWIIRDKAASFTHLPAEEKSEVRRAQAAAASPAAVAHALKTASSGAEVALPQPGNLDLLKLAALLELADEGDPAAGSAADAMLRTAEVDSIRRAASAVPALPAPPNQLRVLALGMVRHLMARDPQAAVLAGETFWRAQHGASAPALAALVQEALWAWSRSDAAAARAWYDSIAAEGLFEDRGEDLPGMSPEDFSRAHALHAGAGTLESRVALAHRLCALPKPDDPAWPALADVWAHKLEPAAARALADALWQNPAVPRERAFALRMAIVTLPTSAPELSALHWAATLRGEDKPDAALAAAVTAAWQRRQPAAILPEQIQPFLSTPPPASPPPP